MNERNLAPLLFFDVDMDSVVMEAWLRCWMKQEHIKSKGSRIAFIYTNTAGNNEKLSSQMAVKDAGAHTWAQSDARFIKTP